MGIEKEAEEGERTSEESSSPEQSPEKEEQGFHDVDFKNAILQLADECFKLPIEAEGYYGGLHSGSAGIALAFYHLSQSSDEPSEGKLFLNIASMILERTYRIGKKFSHVEPSYKCSFLMGEAGLHYAGALIAHAKGHDLRVRRHLRLFAESADIQMQGDCHPSGADDVFVGRAGYLGGALHLMDVLGSWYQVLHPSQVLELHASLFNSGKLNAKNGFSVNGSPLSYCYNGFVYTGAAHGMSTPLALLLGCEQNCRLPEDYNSEIWASVDSLLALQRPDGNFPWIASETGTGEQPDLVSWCHGASGIIYLMAKAYMMSEDEKYLDACIKCGEAIWERGLIKGNSGLCHGIAGNGYALLTLYKITHDKKYYYRAVEFARAIINQGVVVSGTYRDCGLMEGAAGVACFLASVVSPGTSDVARLPFFDSLPRATLDTGETDSLKQVKPDNVTIVTGV